MILLVARNTSPFVEHDVAILRRRWPVRTWIEGPSPKRLAALVAEVRRARLVVGWFAGWHTLAPVALARLLRTPVLMISGGVDVAAMPEIGYGAQNGGPRRWATRWILRRADALVVNSHFSRGEIQRNTGLPTDNVSVVHHGVPDPFGDGVADEPRERVALTIGVVDERNLERKGLRPFVLAAAALPDVPFTLVGRWDGDAVHALRADAAPNVELAGFLEQPELDARLRRAAVYVQASRHEGFGMAVAEAMLAGCIPVVTRAGALPEVVGDAGVLVDEPTPEAIADGVRRALVLGPQARAAARRRVLEHFPLERRERALHALADRLLNPWGTS